MSKVTIEWIETKSPEWKLASVTREDGEKLTEVSVNKVSKKGEPFPNFDTLEPGQVVEGELWNSPAGKWYLFPPKPLKSPSTGAYKQKVIEETMAKKEASIGRFQASKEESIKLMSAERDAVLIVTTFYKTRWEKDPVLEAELDSLIKKKCIEFRDWFMLSHEWNDLPPFEN